MLAFPHQMKAVVPLASQRSNSKEERSSLIGQANQSKVAKAQVRANRYSKGNRERVRRECSPSLPMFLYARAYPRSRRRPLRPCLGIERAPREATSYQSFAIYGQLNKARHR